MKLVDTFLLTITKKTVIGF